MPGNIDNPNLLAAINQAIKALNDLAGEFLNSGDFAEIRDNLEYVGDKIESHRTDMVSQSVSAITAGNTNFSALTAAIEALNLSCAPVINVAPDVVIPPCPTPIINISNDGGAPVSDDVPTTAPITQSDPPPPGWELPSAIDNRKCKVANYNIDALEWVLNKFQAVDLESKIQYGIQVVSVSFALLFRMPAVPAIWLKVAAIYGFSQGIINVFLGNIINLSSLMAVVANRRGDLVCAMYEASSTTEAIDNVVAIFTSEAVGIGNVALIRAIYTIDWLGNLFLSRDTSIEAELDGYVPLTDCGGCVQGDTGVYDFSYSPHNWEIDPTLSRYTYSYVPGCCFQSYINDYPMEPRITIIQQVKHDVQTIRVKTYDNQDAIGSFIQVTVSDSTSGPWVEVARWEFQPNNADVQATINVVDKHIRVRADCFGATVMQIKHVEYINT